MSTATPKEDRAKVGGDGSPAVDPTLNVKDLQEASNKRQDDLREASEKFLMAEVSHGKELATLRAEYTTRLADAESKRIDAIRAVDVNAVAVASERQAAAATVLANQVAQSADALRTLVSTTATAYAEQQRQQMSQVTDRLTLVERAQYEGRGSLSISDPLITAQIASLASEVKSLSASNNTRTGYDAGKVAAIGTGLVGGSVGITAMVMRLLGH